MTNRVVDRRHVPVFGNVIYQDNEYARHCYRGHFKIQIIIIYYKLFRIFECILRIVFPPTGHILIWTTTCPRYCLKVFRFFSVRSHFTLGLH